MSGVRTADVRRTKKEGFQVKFCGYCGQQIPDDANACPYCGRFQEQGFAAPVKKPFPVKAVIAVVLALAVVALLVLGASALLGGGYQQPLDTIAAIANDRTVNAKSLKKAAGAFVGKTGKQDLDKVISGLCELEIYGSPAADFLQERADEALREADDTLGGNVKFSYKISNKKKIGKEDLEAYQDLYQQIGSVAEDTARFADRSLPMVEEYLGGVLTAESAGELLGHVRDFAKELRDAKISAGYELDLVVTGKGRDGSEDTGLTVSVLKLDGQWVVSFPHEMLQEIAEEVGSFSPQDLIWYLL